MARSLTTDDFARLEVASRALLNPLAAEPEEWLLEVGRTVREFLGGESVVLAAPGGARGLYSEDAPDVATACTAYVAAITDGGYHFTDPVVEAWHGMRRREGVEAFSWDINERMVEAQGHRMTDGPIVADAVMGAGYREFAGLLKTTAAGDAMVWVLGRERGGLRFGEAAPAVLQALVPSFRAGLDALTRLGAYRTALDALTEPVVALDADGRVVHRNAALDRLLCAEPERALVESALWHLARDVRRLAFPRRSEPGPAVAPMEREVRTGLGRYTLRASVVPPGAVGPHEAALVTVDAAVAPSASPAEVRDRLGLTAREAEVALLIADGLTNVAIAERLFVAPATAKRHVEAVLGKLGVPNRTSVARRLAAG